MKSILIAASIASLSGCVFEDDNAKPKYGSTGLAVNCRAYVQIVIDSYRMKQYSADESFAGLERNCGMNGRAWRDRRD
ncbi:kynureninase [Lacisediminimonas profundi]|uniref:kynureninase n=1 Tax=Lacisediminimonas profundi TaxID=2603856 RepID=UPI00124BB8D3|nr:kynureninase [Lacisediminimonas profundi]